jgi:CubicO group peptidase (beta-lactamase class C family)
MSGRRKSLRAIVCAALALGWFWTLAGAQSTSAVQGDFAGTLGPLSLKLHIKAAPDGTLSGTLDSPNQGALGIPCADIRIEGQTLSFKVPAVGGTWKGSIENGGEKLAGTWSQGTPMPLDFTRETFVPALKPSRVDGIWLAASQFQGQTVRTQLVIRSDDKGRQFCSVDSPDINVFEIPCANVLYSRDNFSFEVPSVQHRWSGKLSGDGNSLNGIWTPTAGASPPTALNFNRQTQRLRPVPPPPVSYAPAIDPVPAADMESVLRRDLEKTSNSGLLAPGRPTGIAIAVVRYGERRVFSLGAAKGDSLFEIGSISKTFTGLMLAQMIEQGNVRPETPVRELLPKDTVAKPPGGEITLLDLVTQHSGLPRLPDNLRPADPTNPYADYRPADLYQFIGRHGVAKTGKASFQYSNLGLGLLGQALANRAQTNYADLLKRLVLEPLELRESTIVLTADQRRRFISGFSGDLRPAHAWDLDGLAGAGAIRSTAGDMLKFLEANLHPQAIATATSSNAAARTLPAALVRSHELHGDVGPGMRVGYAWVYDSNSGTYWHNGGTGGFTSYALFNPRGNYAAIVLVNIAVSGRGSLADQIGQHIGERFAGKPAISLDNW